MTETKHCATFTPMKERPARYQVTIEFHDWTKNESGYGLVFKKVKPIISDHNNKSELDYAYKVKDESIKSIKILDRASGKETIIK